MRTPENFLICGSLRSHIVSHVSVGIITGKYHATVSCHCALLDSIGKGS